MNAKELLALTIWAMDRDLMSLPITRVLKLYSEACQSFYDYMDPEDDWAPAKLAGDTPDKIFADYIIDGAKWDLRELGISHGNLDKMVIAY